MPNEEAIAVTESSPVERNIEIIPFGTDEAIKLNVSIVQKMIAVPTKQNKLPDATQCIRFMMLCKARHLNPFEGDAYLIGYDSNAGPQFSLITAHQVFLKRAEASESFDGMQSGVIVESSEMIDEREGDMVYEHETLLGGWAKVYRKDRGHPFYRRIKLSTFNTGRSRWEKDPGGMIVKCAEADALRSAFPTHLGGLYTREEMPPIDITPKSAPAAIEFGPAIPEEKPKRHRRTKAQIAADKNVSSGVSSAGNTEPESKPQSSDTGGPSESTRQDTAQSAPIAQLMSLLSGADIPEAVFQRHLIVAGYIEPSDTLGKLSAEKLDEIITSFVEIANEMEATA